MFPVPSINKCNNNTVPGMVWDIPSFGAGTVKNINSISQHDSPNLLTLRYVITKAKAVKT